MKLLISGILLGILWSSMIESKEINQSLFQKIAIEGIDPVSYFLSGKPMFGKPEFQFEWKGAKWRFANAKNLELFKKNPEQYAPQYGGFCAYAVSQGYTAEISPEAWNIHKGKLYLNYDLKVKKLWESQMEQFIEQANKNWPEVSK